MASSSSSFQPYSFATGRPENDALLARAHTQLTAFYRYREEFAKFRGKEENPINDPLLTKAADANESIFEREAVKRWHNEQRDLVGGQVLGHLAHLAVPTMSYDQAYPIVLGLVQEHRQQDTKKNLIQCGNSMRRAAERALEAANEAKTAMCAVQNERDLVDGEFWDHMLFEVQRFQTDMNTASEVAESVLKLR